MSSNRVGVEHAKSWCVTIDCEAAAVGSLVYTQTAWHTAPIPSDAAEGTTRLLHSACCSSGMHCTTSKRLRNQAAH